MDGVQVTKDRQIVFISVFDCCFTNTCYTEIRMSLIAKLLK